MKSLCVTIACITISISTFSQPVIELELFASGFNDPVDIANAGDSRLFIVERAGIIYVVDETGETLEYPFLDIEDKIESGYNEQGLLGLAFAPDYDSTGYFYVNYTDDDGNTVVARYKVSTFDPDIADETSEEIVFTADQPYVNHNGGDLNFGPDGYLYIGLGDGGDGGDPGNRAQNPENKLGKMHRINVNGVDTYTIPADNPFYGSTDTLETIWSLGLRNPWRYSFDALTGDMWIGDVGQGIYEEVDFEPVGAGGKNYGWRCYEADDEFETSGCEDEGYYDFPIFQYNHSYSTGGFAIVGGYVYRGDLYPGMYGYYLFGDNVSGNWWTIYPDGADSWLSERQDDISNGLSTFGEDVNGEIYCAELYTGKIYHVTDLCGDFALSATSIDYICGMNNGSIDITVTAGTTPFNIEWSNGEETLDINDLEPGDYTITVTDDNGCERNLTVTINNSPPFDATITIDENILTASDGVSWQWYLNGDVISGAIAQNYEATESGNYSVEITDANACVVLSDEINFTYVNISLPEYIHLIELYPNPANENIIIGISTSKLIDKIQLQISDATGKIVYTEQIKNIVGDFEKNIALQNLAVGIYKISLSGNDMNWNKSFIVK
ncbi:MAG: PQQ-dependent sugar dehydrogenase [Fimbriimonadaceae bacterium]|nr:PQQ-dependent sugar dehydrogenase [Chitinophagales bacterium]